MKKTVTVKVDKKGRFPLEALKDLIDVSRVHTYKIEPGPGKTAVASFFDKEGNPVLANRDVRAVDEMRNQDIKIPWHVARILSVDRIAISGQQVSISKDGDYVNLVEMRIALDWLADQFGGKVTWE